MRECKVTSIMLISCNPKAVPLLFALATIWFATFSPNKAHALYPDRIIKIVVPFAPGGGTDVVARTLAQEMAKDLAVAGGGHHHRHPGRRRQRTGRLHALDGDVRECGQSEPQCEIALQPG
jgi:hypothetical protein